MSTTSGRAPGVELHTVDDDGNGAVRGGRRDRRAQLLSRSAIGTNPARGPRPTPTVGSHHRHARGGERAGRRPQNQHVHRGGRAYPAEIENLLARHPRSRGCRWWRARRHLGEVGAAFVVGTRARRAPGTSLGAARWPKVPRCSWSARCRSTPTARSTSARSGTGTFERQPPKISSWPARPDWGATLRVMRAIWNA